MIFSVNISCMLKALLFAFIFLPLTVDVGCASGLTPPEEEWNRTFGRGYAESMQQTSDGGYIIAGTTTSYGAGSFDFLLVKTDSNGNELWNKTFGTPNYDWANSVQQTSDGGYIIAGTTKSYGAGDNDFWLVKTDSNGNELWNNTLGSDRRDQANSVQQTSDGGYIIAGLTEILGSVGLIPRFWLVKTDLEGNEQWNKTFCGAWASSVQQTSDNGYIIVGLPRQVIKTDSNGNEQWNKTFGAGVASSVQETSDGGYIITGSKKRNDDGYDYDLWLAKIDSKGNEQWNKIFIETHLGAIVDVQQTSDGGYIIAGITKPNGFSDYPDLWLEKTDSNGNEQWNKTFDGADPHRLSVQQTSDGGYIIAGTTYQFSANGNKIWLIKVGREKIESDSEDSEIIAPEVPIEEDKGMPGFELIFGIAGLLAVISLFNRKNQR